MEQDDEPSFTIDVPQVALLNCGTFEVVNKPEVHLLNAKGNRLCRWTCEYNASLHQEDFDVTQFPYDEQDIALDVGISVYGDLDKQWKPNHVSLGVATESDNERPGSECLFGTVENNVSIPGFYLGKKLRFEKKSISGGRLVQDHFICFSIKARRNHTYFNQNVLTPLLFLHVVAILSLVVPIEEFSTRIAILLAVAFLEIGLRLCFDGKLPKVAYSILIQKLVNYLFYALLLLAVESSLLYFVFVRVLHIRKETPDVGDVCSSKDDDMRINVHVIDGFSALCACGLLLWVGLEMMRGERGLNIWKSRNLTIPAVP